jgi:hypothetical protein
VFRHYAFDTIGKISFGLDLGMPLSELSDEFDAASWHCAMRGTAASPLVWKA